MALGKLFIICAPSGGGKGTLIRRVLETLPNVGYSVSFTTRRPRDGEVEGKDYFFVSRDEFEKMIADGEFLEYAIVHNNYYGTSRSIVEKELNEERDVILEIDVQGAALVREKVSDAISIFIMPPSFEELKERLASRATDSEEVQQIRLQNARSEVGRYKEFDYIIINDDIETAANNLTSIFLASRASRERQEETAQKILSSFTN
jgi:guanylate kinase